MLEWDSSHQEKRITQDKPKQSQILHLKLLIEELLELVNIFTNNHVINTEQNKNGVMVCASNEQCWVIRASWITELGMVELNLADQARSACFGLYNAPQIWPIVEDVIRASLLTELRMVELNLADQARGTSFSLYNALQIRPIVGDVIRASRITELGMVELNLADHACGACFSLYNALQIWPIVEDVTRASWITKQGMVELNFADQACGACFSLIMLYKSDLLLRMRKSWKWLRINFPARSLLREILYIHLRVVPVESENHCN